MAGVYIHIPFCRQACHYCNFYFTTSQGNKDKFIEALLREIELSKNFLEGEKIETIYFGGGTPSLLSYSELSLVIRQLENFYDLTSLSEFTLEANPDDLSAEKIKELYQLRRLGFNRFSIGIQSFFDEDLVYMNRAHNSNEAFSSIKRVQDAGFENITIDLIYGTPTMNDERWHKNLEAAFALNVPHISSYALTVEPKTNLDRKIKKGESKVISEEQAASQFIILTNEMTKAGYEQYEISNFAKQGKYAVHNSNYWSGKKYLGIGPSAHSYNKVSRKWNVANNIRYIQSIASGIIPYEEEILTKAQQINERIMTSLRTTWGLNLANFETQVADWIKQDLKGIDLKHYTLKDNILVLTQNGKLFADAIAASLFVTEEQFLEIRRYKIYRMATIKPFKAVRPKTGLAEQVAALPYDVMNTAEAREMANGNPYSFLHVSRAEIDFPENIDEHSQAVYDKAKDNFYKMISDGVLFQDEQPCLYIYAQVMNGRRQVGLVACSSIDDYFNDVIKKHELTRPEKEQDRIAHMQTLQVHVGPIFLTYPKNDGIDAIVDNVITHQKPVYDFKASDNIQHTVWVIQETNIISQILSTFEKQVPYTYIADGHHRAASGAKVGKKMREQNPAHTGEEEYNFFLSVLFPDKQLAIMDYNRVVKDLNGNTPEEFLKKVGDRFLISKAENKKPARLHLINMYLQNTWYELMPKEGSFKNDPIGILDVSILQNNLLNPVLGIADPRTDKRIDFIGGIRGMEELERRVDSGEMKVAFALYPVSLKQLMDIANSGNIMPPKSTWFEPKLRDGLFSHLF